MKDSNPLWQDIIIFSRNKTKFAIGFILLGLLGLVLPVIPGILLLTVGVFLLKPEWYDSFRRWFEKNN
jgi:uncharacterized membrane protein YbaN (DUF454 family)